MGTALTGTTPQDTYDSLIKVTDNGPLSATAKYLSDGLGNDSVLALSTSKVGIGTSSASGKLHIKGAAADWNLFGEASDGSQLYGIYEDAGAAQLQLMDANGVAQINLQARAGQNNYINGVNVGIGTTAPTNLLHLSGSSATPSLRLASVSEGFYWDIGRENATTGDFVFNNASGGGSSERVRILAGGGITFNGDTAAANALDDYEEGTWTPNFTLDSGTVTAHTASGSYTKIGRQVSVTLSLVFTTTSSAQVDTITGLPFTAQNTAEVGIGAVRENSNTGDMWQWRVNANGTSGVLRRYDNAVAISNGDSFVGTLTYFV